MAPLTQQAPLCRVLQGLVQGRGAQQACSMVTAFVSATRWRAIDWWPFTAMVWCWSVMGSVTRFLFIKQGQNSMSKTLSFLDDRTGPAVSSCVTYQHPEPVEAKDALKQAQGTTAALNVPDAVQAELLSTTTGGAPSPSPMSGAPLPGCGQGCRGQRIFCLLDEGWSLQRGGASGRGGAHQPGLCARGDPAEVLDTVANMYGYDIRRTGTVTHVYPPGLRTESVPVNYLMLTRQGLSRTSSTSGGVTEQDNNNDNNSSSSSSSDSSNNSNSDNSNNNGSNNSNNGTVIETGSKSNFWKDLETRCST
jgi:MSHA biogenesis protein MshL